MAIQLYPLPYNDEALAPAITAETLSFHYGKHHKAYVDNTNKMTDGTDMADSALEDIISSARGTNQGLFNNAAQTWNHAFYWHSMRENIDQPSQALLDKIGKDFGSMEKFTEEFAARGVGEFGSGWVWLADRDGKLSIETTHDGDTLADSKFNPLLVLDVWEHAYYLDHQNLRAQYLNQVIANHLNWSFADENMSRGICWEYASQ